MDYPTLIKKLNFPSQLSDCASGAIKLPSPTFQSQADWYGFPPALLPIWSEGSGPTYMGVWRHWPEGRRLSFVGMYVELGRNVVEIARTNDQFLSYAVIRLIVANDGISGELVEFARRVGVNN